MPKLKSSSTKNFNDLVSRKSPLKSEFITLKGRHVILCSLSSEIYVRDLFEGIFRKASRCKDRNRDTAWFAAKDKDWPQIKECFHTYLHERLFNIKEQQKSWLSSLRKTLLFKINPAIHTP